MIWCSGWGRAEPSPRIVILIDDLADIMRGGNLARLLNDGHVSGVHLVASGLQTSGSVTSSAGFGTLIHGKGAPGYFEVMDRGAAVRFTAASITPAEVEQVVIGAMPKREPTRLHQAAALVA